MTKVSVKLLGGFDVTVDDRVITGFESGSARALLARLAAEPGRPLSRAMLAELLWPDRPEGAAAANLRHSLSVVRKAIGDTDPDEPILITSGTDVILDAAEVDVDLARFERLTCVDWPEPGAAASWEDGVGLRRGAFLAGFDAHLSEQWETWLTTMRTRVDAAASTALQRLAEVRERTGEHREAIAHVRSWIELDPWNEKAHRMLLRLLALEDDRGAALVHADSFSAALLDELGIEPSAETQEVVDSIRSGGFPLRDPEAPELPARAPSGVAREPCVGRDDELRWLRAHLDEAQTGSGRVVFIVGQPGSGKTVLMRAFELDALDAMPNLVIARGACNGYSGGGDPFLPFRQILGQLLGDIELDWMRGVLTPREAADLWRAVPVAVEAVLDHGPSLLGTLVDAEALATRFERAFADHPLAARVRAATTEARRRTGDPTRQRQPLVEQCASVLAALAAIRPIMLTIDDMQWADTGTLDVVSQLAAHASGVPMLLVGALRPGELDRSDLDPVRRTVVEIAGRSRADCRLELSGSREFVDAWLDTEPNVYGEAFRDSVYRTTGGNPLFTVEVVRALKQSGQLCQDDQGRWVSPRTDRWDDVTPRIEATIAARLASVPEEFRADLDVASVQGQEFVAQVVAAARGVPTQDVERRLSSLCAAPSALLRPGGFELVGDRRLDRFEFRHALFQQHLVEHLAPAVRRQLHEATGCALENSFIGCTDRVVADLALHFDAAGVTDKAIEYHAGAGRTSSWLAAYDDAVRHDARALELLATLEPTPERRKQELALVTSLGACHQWLFGYNAPETSAVYERLRELTRQVIPSFESAGAIGGLVTVDGLRANYVDALAEAEQLLDLASVLDSPPIETVARMHLGWLLLMVGRIVEADEQLTMAVERYDSAWDDWLTPIVGMHVPSTAMAWHAITSWHLGHPDRARSAGDRSIEMARAACFPFGLAFALAVGGCLLGGLSDEAERIDRSAAELATVARAEGFTFYEAAALIHGGSAKLRSGDPEGAVEDMRLGLQQWSAMGTEAFVTWIRTWLTEALVQAGDVDGARAELAEVDRRLADGAERIAELRRGYVAGMLRSADGEPEAAAREYRTAIAVARAARARGPELQAEAALTALAADVG